MQVTKFNLVTDLQIMLSNVTHSNFYFECNTERSSIKSLSIALGSYEKKNFKKARMHFQLNCKQAMAIGQA